LTLGMPHASVLGDYRRRYDVAEAAQAWHTAKCRKPRAPIPASSLAALLPECDLLLQAQVPSRATLSRHGGSYELFKTAMVATRKVAWRSDHLVTMNCDSMLAAAAAGP